MAAPSAAHSLPAAAAILVVDNVGVGAAVVKIVKVFAGKGVGSVDNAGGGVRIAVAGRVVRIAVRHCWQARANTLRCCHRAITYLKHHYHESESSSITKMRANTGVRGTVSL